VCLLIYLRLAAYGLLAAPPELVAASQLGAASLNLNALVPQFVLNYQHKSKGDYLPVTACVAATGCVIGFFTITQLTHSDPILLASFGVALVLNAALLAQILYYGIVVEGLSLSEVFVADLGNTNKTNIENGIDLTKSNSNCKLPTLTRRVWRRTRNSWSIQIIDDHISGWFSGQLPDCSKHRGERYLTFEY
jgi:hypothetical protein